MARLRSDLTHLALKARDAAGSALLKTAADVVDLAKQLAPVDTGALRDSYAAEPLSSTTVLVGSDIEYAPFVEYGTSRSPAQPHLTPAFMQAEKTFEARLAEEAAKAVS